MPDTNSGAYIPNSLLNRNVTYRFIPGSSARAAKVAQTAGACRYVWNRVLADTQEQYRLHCGTDRFCEDTLLGLCFERPAKPSLTFFSLGRRFTALRAQTPWLQALPYHPVRHTLKYQVDAWKRSFADPKAGRPKFKARRGDDSFTIGQDADINAALNILARGTGAAERRGAWALAPPMNRQRDIRNATADAVELGI